MSNLLRSALVVCSFSLLAAAGAVVVSSGCDDTCDPDIDPNCTRFLFEPSDAAPPSCVPSENAGSIPASCGIFVSIAKPIDPELGTLEGEGTKDAPFRKLSDAITLARKTKQPIYVCAEVFKEAIRVPEGVTIYGGMSCFVANWVYPLIGGDGKAKKTTVAPDAGKVPLKVIENTSEGGSSEDAGVRAARLFDFAFLAADAKTAGGSSIAAIFDAVNVELTRCDLRAGSGASGAAGEKPPSDSPSPSDPDDPAIAGNAGSPSCMGGGTGNPGAEAKANMLCAASIGGAGGVGLEDMGVAGLPGQPAVEGFGVGGIGAVEPDTCLAGTNGRVGQSGAAGFGALKDDVGKITIAGYTGPSGQFGAPGEPGQGGGGGGGAKGAPNCYGASGGSGGAGGCGGKGGGGGQGGGSSIALVSLGANLVMTDVLLMAADGGKGGDGAEGQSGGVGGRGGKSGAGVPEMGLLPSCSGGDGGQGGFGGRGGGGRGGHSLGLAYAGAAPSLTGITFQVGAPGLGGAGEGASGKGATGVVAETRFFP